jgi:serine/threonine protein kinase
MQRCPKCQKDYPKGVDFCPKDGSRTVPAPASAATPRKAKTEIGNYVLVRKLGEGGMGVVFEAEHKMIQKRVALKMLHADKANDVQIYERFKREAKISSQIKSPHIVDITDFGQTENGDLYLVMEFLEGKDLGHLLEQRKFLSVAEAANILIQSTQALAIAHKAGVVHRDLKPDNVFLITKDGDPNYVKLLDFGIAKIAEASAALTKAGMIIGTPEYMSPEQCEGRPVDARSDIYSLGIIAYHMLTGKVPFSHEHFSRVLLMHSSEPPPPLRKTRPALQVSPVVEATIAKMMAKRREDRYQTMEEVLAALNTWNVGKPQYDEPEPTQIASAAMIMAQGKPMPTLNLDSYEDAATQTGEAPGEVMNLGSSMLVAPDDDENQATVSDSDIDATLAPGGMMRPPPGMRASPTIVPNHPFHPPQPADTQPSPQAVVVQQDIQKVIETTALPRLRDQLQASITNAPANHNNNNDEAPRSRILVIGISAAVAAILAVVLYVFVFSKKTPPPAPPPAPVKTSEKKDPTPPPSQPAAPVIEEKITLTVKAKPTDGVEVRIEGSTELLGTLPGPIFIPMGAQEVKLEFTKRGYAKMVKAITPNMSQDLNVVLAPVKKDTPKEDPDDPIKDPFKNP